MWKASIGVPPWNLHNFWYVHNFGQVDNFGKNINLPSWCRGSRWCLRLSPALSRQPACVSGFKDRGASAVKLTNLCLKPSMSAREQLVKPSALAGRRAFWSTFTSSVLQVSGLEVVWEMVHGSWIEGYGWGLRELAPCLRLRESVILFPNIVDHWVRGSWLRFRARDAMFKIQVNPEPKNRNQGSNNKQTLMGSTSHLK